MNVQCIHSKKRSAIFPSPAFSTVYVCCTCTEPAAILKFVLGRVMGGGGCGASVAVSIFSGSQHGLTAREPGFVIFGIQN